MAMIFDGTNVSNSSKFSSEFTNATVVSITDVTPDGKYPRFEVEVQVEVSPMIPGRPAVMTNGRQTAAPVAEIPAVYDNSVHIVMAFALPQDLITGHGTPQATFDDQAFIGMTGTRKITGKKDGWDVCSTVWQ